MTPRYHVWATRGGIVSTEMGERTRLAQASRLTSHGLASLAYYGFCSQLTQLAAFSSWGESVCLAAETHFLR